MLDTRNGSYDLATPPDDPRALFAESVSAAAGGNPVAAAIAASLIHLNFGTAAGSSADYDALLQQVLDSEDAELIVCVGEEILAGNIFDLNVDLGHRFFERADQISGYMGSYAAAVLLIKINPDRAIEILGRSADVGHLTSLALKRVLENNRRAIFGRYMRIIHALAIGIQLILTRDKADLGWRLWRYGDLSNQTGGSDRRRPLEGLKLLRQ
jgi:hypothetical protein